MSANGFQYFLEKNYGSDFDTIVPFFCQFLSSGFYNDFLPNNEVVSGISFSGSNFSTNNDLSFFNGNSTILFESNDLSENYDKLSFFATYKKTGDGSHVLFSSLSSGIGSDIISGFSFGVNRANKLFFEYYDPVFSDNLCITFPKVVNDKNCVWLKCSNNGVGINVYNYGLDNFDSFFYFYPNYRPHESNTFSIGGCPNSESLPAWAETGKFVGFFDEIAISNQNISQEAFVSFASGSVYSGYVTGELSGYVDDVRVTGRESGSFLVFSGITGQEIIETGVLIDDFGNEYSGVEVIDLYGEVYESGLIDMTGVVSVPVFFDEEERFDSDMDSANDFGFFGINPIIPYDSSDLHDFFFASGGGFYSKNDEDFSIISNNNHAKFDRIRGGFRANGLNRDRIAAFLNGVFQHTGSLTGSRYSNYEITSNDYYYSGGVFYSSGQYDSNDDLSYIAFKNPIFYKTYENFSHLSGTGNCNIDKLSNSDFIFFNGQKLTSGVEYSGSGNLWLFSNENELFYGESGKLTIFSGLSGFSEVYNYGEPIFSSSGFFDNTQMLWINGILKNPHHDYIFFSPVDLLSGKSSAGKYNDTLFENDQSFFFEF